MNGGHDDKNRKKEWFMEWKDDKDGLAFKHSWCF